MQCAQISIRTGRFLSKKLQLYSCSKVLFNVTNPDDHQLVDKIVRGDGRAFQVLTRNTQRLVNQIVCRMISDPRDREDIVQDVYMKAFHKISNFRFQCKLSTWLGQIAYNTCLTESLQATDDQVEPLLVKKELAAVLQKAIDTLPPVYQTLVVLFHTEELSNEEIGVITGLPNGTIKSYLFRARKMLKEILLTNYKREDL
jgi:RNA polymerase sigma factor (sigma-70 family)